MGSYEGGVTPERMFGRQEQKGHVVREVLGELGLFAGDEVLDVGSGPGFASLLASERVGPTGKVWALDVEPAPLAFLQDRAKEIDWLHVVEGDAADFALPSDGVRRFLLTDVLHDVADARAVLHHLAKVLPQGARGVVSDYLPVEQKWFGPDPRRRIPEERVQEWLGEVGFTILKTWHPPDEHYAFLVEVQGKG
ncbi:MAG: methyltransferase domain-containing protein [Thermaerobacter sp.]|nr:methyltransferase domain-containing protein [Thermaerobacter sp.]